MELRISEDSTFELYKVYSDLCIVTDTGKKLYICLRDSGWDMNIDGGSWHHIDSDKDFKDFKDSENTELDEVDNAGFNF